MGVVLTPLHGGTIRIDGLLDEGQGALFAALLATLPTQEALELELAGLEVERPAELVTAVAALRQLAQRCGQIRLRAAPQLLAHNLYRIGALAQIQLLDPRQEEPYG